MSTTCERHPTQPAWWRCPRCYKSFCPQCISKRASGQLQNKTLYFCPRCNVETEPLELSHVIPPFWTRLHKLFVYPFSSVQAIVLLVVLSLLSTFIGFFFLIQIVFWAIMVKYSFEALRSTAEGRFLPPPLGGKVFEGDYGIVIKQVALYVALGFLIGFLAMFFGRVALVLSIILMAVALPAMLLILIINESLRQALNPVMVVGVISRIGGAYFLLLFFLMLLGIAPAVLSSTIVGHLPAKLHMFISIAAKNYYTLISYHLMGYVVLQYHQRLGYPLDLDTILSSLYPAGAPGLPQSQAEEKGSRHQELLNEVALLIQEGAFEKALSRIEQQVNIEDIEDLELSQRYIGLLKMCKQQDKFLKYAPRYLELAVKSGAKSKALEVYAEGLGMDKSFAPQPLVLFKIASWLNESNKSKEAIKAFNCLVKNHPKDAIVPKAYYCAAQIFNERLKNVEQAKKILNGLLRKFPDHEIAGFAKNYLEGL